MHSTLRILRLQRCRWVSCSSRRFNTTISRRDEPLRILFCGSDEFSIASLRALHDFSKERDSNILSIDVATKCDKRTGRGLKILTPSLIKPVAHSLDLPIHQFDTFTGWQPPEYSSTSQGHINLIVAVSFGLLIPARIINGASFGGLNVHPSLLPDLKGAAPLNWAIIKGYHKTGVSIQTLHPTKMDEGVVLTQTQPISILPDIGIQQLRDQLAPVGAELLVQAIRNKSYMQPYQGIVTSSAAHVSMAPKIMPQTRLLNPCEDDLEMILRKNRAIPKLYAYTSRGKSTQSEMVRLIFGDDMRAALPEEVIPEIVNQVDLGVPFAISTLDEKPNSRPKPIYVVCKGGGVLAIPRLLVAGRKEGSSSQVSVGGRLFSDSMDIGANRIHTFGGPLQPEQH